MTDEVNQLPSSPFEESPLRDDSFDMATRTPLEKELNVMIQGDLDHLRETYSFPARIPKEGETILFIRPSEVAFYEATFLADLRLSIYPTIKRILNFYNICPTQLSPNAWRSVVYVLVIW